MIFTKSTSGKIQFVASRCRAFIKLCKFHVRNGDSGDENRHGISKKIHLKLDSRLPNRTNEHTVCTPVFCISLCLTAVYLQNRREIGELLKSSRLCFSWVN